MISKIGNFLQLITIFSTILTIIGASASFLTFGSKNNITKCIILVYSKRLFYLSCVSIVLAFLLLVYGFIISDFSIENVFLNSSTLKPLIFKIAGSWASHEGSILLWFCLLSIISFAYAYLTTNIVIIRYQLIILSLIQLLFSSFIYLTSNPFYALSFRPSEGLGLNPILQDIALSIHPPILYLGYVSYVVPFTSACIILLEPKLKMEALKLAKLFSTLGILALTLGVGLGSWWAYRELGWGGFWFFDPVENISLMPWLTAIALYHSMLITIKSEHLSYYTIMLSIITFLLTILGTFLVRSGLLISVHSFSASTTRATYMFTIFTLIYIPSIALLCLRGNKIISNTSGNFKDAGIIWGNIFWLISMVILIVATIYPIIYSLLYDRSISVSIQYFISSFLPLLIPTIILAAIIPKKGENYIFTLILSILITLISSYWLKFGYLSWFAMVSSCFLILQTIHLILVKSDYFKEALKANIVAMAAGHLGFGLLVLSITLNSLLQNEIEFIGKVGDSITSPEFNISLRNVKIAQGVNYYRQIAEFWIQDNNGSIIILKPENRLYVIEKSLSQESDIYSYLTHDIYAVLSQINDEVIHAKIYYRPMISFIWFSIIIMGAGFLISLTKKEQTLNYSKPSI